MLPVAGDKLEFISIRQARQVENWILFPERNDVSNWQQVSLDALDHTDAAADNVARVIAIYEFAGIVFV